MPDQNEAPVYYVILRTLTNLDSNPLIAVHHNKAKALDEYRRLSRVIHYYYKLVKITEGKCGQRIRTTIRSEYYNKDAAQWQPTAELYK